MNLYIQGVGGDVLDVFRASGLFPTEPNRAILQIAIGDVRGENLSSLPLIYQPTHWIDPVLLARAALTIAPTHFAADFLLHNQAHRGAIQVVRPGLNLMQWQTIGEHDGYILWDDVRGKEKLFRSVTRGESKLNFVTQAPVNSTDNVTSLGPVSIDRWSALLRNAAVYVMTDSERNYYPQRIHYALAAGVPVVCLDHSSHNEFVQSGENGMLCQATEDSLRTAIRYCIAQRYRLSQNAAHSALSSAWSTTIPRLTELYTQVARGVTPVTATFHLLHFRATDLDAAIRHVIETGLFSDLVIWVSAPCWGMKILNHTLTWFKDRENMYGSALVDGVRVLIRRYNEGTYPLWQSKDRIPTPTHTKYYAYNTAPVNLADLQSLKQNVAALETNPGIGTIREGDIILRIVPPKENRQ